MKKLGSILLKGLVTILPIGLTVYFVYWLGITTETLLSKPIRWVDGAERHQASPLDALSCTRARFTTDHQGPRDHAASRELTRRSAHVYQPAAHSLGDPGTCGTKHHDLSAHDPARGARQRTREMISRVSRDAD